jgi:macrolide-specific efflux system membrane fusion protein
VNTETVSNCLITLKHDVDVAAEEMGVLVDILVTEGQVVQKDQQIAQIDDKQAEVLREVARHKLLAAEEEAKNTLNVEHAKAASQVREVELYQAKEAEKAYSGTVSDSEMRRLAYSLKEARLAIGQAEHDLRVAAISADVQRAELQSAELDVDRRKIKSPLDGVIVKQYVQAGNWVRPGEPVVRVISMDKLYVDGYVSAARFLPAEIDKCVVSGTVQLPRGGQEAFEGVIVFASLVIEAGPRFLVRAEVQNKRIAVRSPAGTTRPAWLLRPGDVVSMTIHLDQRAAELGLDDPAISAR